MVFSGDDFVAGAPSALSTSEEPALVDRLVDTTKKVVFVLLGLLAIAVIA